MPMHMHALATTHQLANMFVVSVQSLKHWDKLNTALSNDPVNVNTLTQ